MSEKWETVPARSIIKKPSSQSHKKENGTSTSSKAGYLYAPEAPVFEEKTQYDALNVKDKKEKSSEAKRNGETTKPKSSIPRLVKKDGPKKSGQKPTLETLVPTISGEQFEELYSKSRALFKENPLLWLKDLTGQLNLKLDELTQTDTVFTNRPEDYPSSLLKPEVRKVFNKSIRECSPELLQVFLEQLIQSIMTDMSKGLSVYGYQIVAQILSKYKPDLFTLQTNKCLDLIIANKNVPAKCLTVMWVIGQGGCQDFRAGLKVWTTMMLPVIGIKTLAGFAITYLGRIIKKADNKLDQGYNVIEMKNYFLLLDGVFTSSHSLQPSLQKSLKEYYPELKKLAFGKNPQKVMQRFFPSFLTRLTQDGANTEFQRELLENIVFCLTSDPQCFSVWKHVYAEHLMQSSVVLNYLADNWQVNSSLGLNYKLVKDSVNAFVVKNKELSRSHPGLESANLACVRFQEAHTAKAEDSMSAIKCVLILCLLSAAGWITFDSYQSGSFKESKTQKLLADSGLDVIATSFLTHLTSSLSVISKFLIKNIPKWTETAMVYIEPVLDVVWNYTVSAIKYLLEVSEPIRMWLAENVPYFIDWVVMHPAWGTIYNYILQIWAVIEPYAETGSNYGYMVLDKLKQMF